MTFIPDPTARTVRLPVRVVDGALQPFYGPTWPRLKEGAIGELTLPAHAFLDAQDVSVLTSPLGVEILPKGTRLLAAVWPTAAREGVIATSEMLWAEGGHATFVELRIAEPLRLGMRGTKRAALARCGCYIPSIDETRGSVNEAYTRISEVYEPQRRTHTGNVFERVFYQRGVKTGCEIWMKLDGLRTELEAKLEQRFRNEHQRSAAR